TIVGLKMPLTRGFYDVRPFVGVQVPVNGVRSVLTAFIVPIDVLFGAEYNLYLGRLTVTPYGGVGASYIYVSEALSGTSFDTSSTYLPHIGAMGYLRLSYLVTRDWSLYAEAGGEYWLSLATDLYTSYGGPGFGAGVSIKF
ncbi:MAG TPA: hypothetical protein VMC79_11560, partial [Rectinemataceae bacterium]|nr:hypothetical protein [Rectinemataceae bacterium]